MINGNASETAAGIPAIGAQDHEAVEQIDKELARFVTRYLDTPLKVEILVHLAQHRSHFYSVGNLKILASARPEDTEAALIELESRGLILIQRRRNTLRPTLSQIPAVMRLSQLLWRYSRSPAGMARVLDLVRRRK